MDVPVLILSLHCDQELFKLATWDSPSLQTHCIVIKYHLYFDQFGIWKEQEQSKGVSLGPLVSCLVILSDDFPPWQTLDIWLTGRFGAICHRIRPTFIFLYWHTSCVIYSLTLYFYIFDYYALVICFAFPNSFCSILAFHSPMPIILFGILG